jgi:hypothetical protein
MAAVLKLLDVLPCDYKLIAVHSALDDYRLAYFLNKTLQLQLAKENQKASLLDTVSGKYFSYYYWENPLLGTAWHCIGNKLLIEKEMQSLSLFESTTSLIYLIDKYKKVDYFLKIDTERRMDLASLLSKISEIPATTAYTIDTDTLNNKYKQIFQEC